MYDVNVDCHERRMNEVILKVKNEELGNILAYMSGYAGNHEFFNEVFWSAVENSEPLEDTVLINYEEILNQWAEKVYEEIDKAEKRKEVSELGSSQYCINRGYSDGLAISMAFFRMFEQKAQKKAMKIE